MDEKLRILLCEDDENLGMLLREYLQAKGYAAELYPEKDWENMVISDENPPPQLTLF